MNNAGTILTIETTVTRTPRNRDRINFYTQQRRVDFGRFLFQTAERIRAERAVKNKESKQK